jgi:hypothetical protein
MNANCLRRSVAVQVDEMPMNRRAWLRSGSDGAAQNPSQIDAAARRNDVRQRYACVSARITTRDRCANAAAAFNHDRVSAT